VPERTDALWVVRAGSDLARRARRPLPAVVREALSACEGCRACTDVCPPHLLGRALQPDRIVRALAHGLEPPPGAGACVGCSICDLVCPAGLTPRRVVGTLPRTEGEDGPPSPDRDLRRVAMNVALVRLGISPETPLPRWAASP
jgi:heterodisulfide reductase subunit C